VGASGLAILGVLSGTGFGQKRESGRIHPEAPTDVRERMEQARAWAERIQKAKTPEEQMKLAAEARVQRRTRTVEALQGRLGASDQEWAIIKPRVARVYDLLHPLPQFSPAGLLPRNPVDEKKRELRELLRDENAPADQIKAALIAFRAAGEQARQDLSKARQHLRQILTLRQEATLVLDELLD